MVWIRAGPSALDGNLARWGSLGGFGWFQFLAATMTVKFRESTSDRVLHFAPGKGARGPALLTRAKVRRIGRTSFNA